MYEPRAIEKKWQDKWKKDKIFEADPDPKKKKKFITIPYPYASGPTHIGHGRSYVNGDIFTRYYRAQGYNVLLPMAFHITGTPVLAISSSIERNEDIIIQRMKEYVSLHTNDSKVVDQIVREFVDPWKIVNYFSKTIQMDMNSIGMSIDWRRKFTTGDKIYNKLIEWQYTKFHDKGYIEQGEYPILYCPRDKNAVGEDDISSGDELNLDINEFICIKFPYDGGYLVPATLRPETIYGVTNLWVNPKGDYIYAKVNGEKWIVSEDAKILLEEQGKTVIILEKFKGVELIGKKAQTVHNSRELPILPGGFVDTSTATGVVYSVPAHAPYDYVALEDLKNDVNKLEEFGLDKSEISRIEPIKIIELEGFGDYPAKEYVNRYNIKNQNDQKKLDDATAENYKAEFYNGILNENCGEFKGKSVRDAVELVIEDLISNDMATKLFIPVTKNLKCKCGEKIIVTMLENQWFLNFNAGNWKEEAFRCLDGMKIVPNKYRSNFNHYFNWLEKRPCARKRGLGTHLPFDKNWIIESLSDSTIYMAFYTIAHHINEHQIEPEQLQPEFFDFVYLDVGDVKEVSESTKIDKSLLKKMQKEFQYWYPVDHRHTAIMHISNHLSFYIFHHVGIFPDKYWPKFISLIEPVIVEGQKMGKSKGNLISLASIQKKYSADLFRFYISHSADLGINVDWREKEIQPVEGHLSKFFTFFRETIENSKEIQPNYEDLNSRYSKAVLSKIIKNFMLAEESLKEFNLRKYLQIAFYETNLLIQDFRRNSKDENEFLMVFKIIHADWLKILSLAIPHLCEELWEIAGNESYLSQVIWKGFQEKFINEDFESEFQYILNVIEDITNIKRVIKSEGIDKVYLYTAPLWKYKIDKIIISNEGNFKAAMNDIKSNSDLISNREAVNYAKKRNKERIWEFNRYDIDEENVLTEFEDVINSKSKSEIILNSDHDPKQKSKNALPNKPAIYIESN